MKNIVFEQHQIRKSKKQKSAFISFIHAFAERNNYACNVEKGSFGARNIVIGDPETAKVIYTAHYDTCVALPFPNFITPKHISIYLLYSLLVTAAILAVGGLSAVLFTVIASIFSIENLLIWILMYECSFFLPMILMMFGPANKNTANDNTSGVMTLIHLMEKMPEDKRKGCAFIFFDLEEMGLFGSAGFASKHKNIRNNTVVINFDCVSDGDNFIFTLPKKLHSQAEYFSDAYKSDKFNVEVLKKGCFYPSDQANFKKGVGVAALKRFKDTKILYMDRIHTKKDTVYSEENIHFLVDASIRFLEIYKTA